MAMDLNKNKRYLQLGKFYPPDWGGIETVTYNIANGLTAMGIVNATMVFGQFNSQEKLTHGNFKSILYRFKHFKLFGKPVSFGYIDYLKKIASNYDIVIVHLPNPIALIALIFSGFKGRVILYWHSDIINKGILGFLITPLEYWVIFRANVIIAPTNAHLQFSKYSKYLLIKGRVSPYPVDLRQVKIAQVYSSKPRSIIGKKIINIISVGRLVDYKGIEYLIKAISLLSDNYVLQLDIIGSGPLFARLKSLIYDLNLQKVISMRGEVSNEVREELLCNADIFCFPSITKAEMYGMVQIEAMCHALPIISTNIVGSGAPELTRMTGAGIVVTPRSSAELALAIKKLIENPDIYSNLSCAGTQAIINIFNSSLLIENLCKLCQD